MGFVGGGGNIDITTALPPSSFVYCCKHQIVYGFSLSHFLWLPETCLVLLCCVWARCLGSVGLLDTFEMVTEHFANPNLTVVVAKC